MFNFGSPANPPKTGTAPNPLTSTPVSAGTLQFNLGQSAASGDGKSGSTMFPLATASSAPSLGFGANFNQPKQAVAPTLNFGAPTAAPGAGFATGFASPAPAATTASGLSFGFGSSTATPVASSAAPTLTFGLGAPAATCAAPTVSFGLGAPASTSAAPTVSFGLGAPASTSAAPTVSFGLGAPASTTAAPSASFGLGAPASTSAPSLSFGFGAPATSTSTPSLSFGFGSSTSTTAATSSTTFTPILSSAATTAPTSVLKFGSTPTATIDASKPLPTSTTVAATSTAASASSGFSIGGVTTSAAGAPATTAPAAAPASAVGSLTFAQLEDSINKWTIDLEEQGKFFINQAKQLNAWDGLLISNGEKILSLNSSIEKVKQQQSQLDQELDFILAQQKELEELIIPLEKELVDVPVVDIDRNQMYQFSEIIDFQLKQISDDLKEIIESINESNKDEEVSNPITQISKILNAHMNSLQWIDRNTAQINRRLEEIAKIEDTNRQNLSVNNSFSMYQ